MTCDGNYDSNMNTDKLLSLLAGWDAEDCMEVPLMLHMI